MQKFSNPEIKYIQKHALKNYRCQIAQPQLVGHLTRDSGARVLIPVFGQSLFLPPRYIMYNTHPPLLITFGLPEKSVCYI